MRRIRSAPPMSLAWDGTNLYVTIPSIAGLRSTRWAPTMLRLPVGAETLAASTYANGLVAIGALINAGDIVTISIGTP